MVYMFFFGWKPWADGLGKYGYNHCCILWSVPAIGGDRLYRPDSMAYDLKFSIDS